MARPYSLDPSPPHEDRTSETSSLRDLYPRQEQILDGVGRQFELGFTG
jgi:hypothetical protein